MALWESYREVLRHIKVLAPACGSEAFLIAPFDFLQAEYARANNQLAALRGGQTELFDLDRHILTHNCFGVDLSPESVEIAKLALWLKSARTDRPLNDLDANLLRGNSIVSPAPDLPPELAAEAFDWRAAFPQVFAAGLPAATAAQAGGVDCAVGNPPYIRQEWLGPCKPAFKAREGPPRKLVGTEPDPPDWPNPVVKRTGGTASVASVGVCRIHAQLHHGGDRRNLFVS